MAEKTELCSIVGAMDPDCALLPPREQGDLLIAADGGYTSLYREGIHPNLVLGDFDSLPAPPDHPNIVRLPRIKEETDMGFAVNHALRMGYRRFLLLGGLGGRLDHTLANLQCLAGLSRRGGRGILAGQGTCVSAVTNGTFFFPGGMEGYLSVFCSGDRAEGVTLRGLKYPLERETLTCSFPLGVSNEFQGARAQVSVARGTLLLVWTDPTDARTLRALLNQAEEEPLL